MKEEKRRILTSISISAAIVAVMWVVKAVEMIANISVSFLGILPIQAKGLPGILFSPLIHADLAHLTANSAPFFILTAALFYYYKSDAIRILIYSWLITGLWVWLFARGNAVHIGASGVVYALAAFHFVSGVIRREPRLMAFSLLVAFLYGSMVWGVFPEFFPERNISWESHLMGFLAGTVLAFFFKHSGPQPKVYLWPEEDDEETPEWYKEDSTVPPLPGATTSTAEDNKLNIN